jgi:hypothetical protein
VQCCWSRAGHSGHGRCGLAGSVPHGLGVGAGVDRVFLCYCSGMASFLDGRCIGRLVVVPGPFCVRLTK